MASHMYSCLPVHYVTFLCAHLSDVVYKEESVFFFFPKWSMLDLCVEPPAQTILQNANEKKTC